MDVTVPLAEAGLDSVGSVELRNSISQLLGTELPATVAFDYPTISGMAKYIAERKFGSVKQEDSHDSTLDDAQEDNAPDILKSLTAIVEGVLDSTLDINEPLMSAGLDSIGEPLIFLCLSKLLCMLPCVPLGRWNIHLFH